jgi:FkbM family methyltransferase
MKILIASPDQLSREIEISPAMEAHFNEPIQHANTILKQINDGMYRRWFDGQTDMVCMDFGANVGLVSLYMLPACNYLYCVEPTPSHRALLKELLIKQDSDGSLLVSDSALADTEGTVKFATGHATENKINENGNGVIEIPSHTLSYYINEVDRIIDFCKVDIEGGEMKALTTEQLKFAYGKVKAFFVEVHPAFNGGMDENREELITRFKDAGYNIETLDYQTIVATCG